MPVSGHITVNMEFSLDNDQCAKALDVIVPDNDSSVSAVCKGGKLLVEIRLRDISSLFSVPNEILSQLQIFEEIEKKL